LGLGVLVFVVRGKPERIAGKIAIEYERGKPRERLVLVKMNLSLKSAGVKPVWDTGFLAVLPVRDSSQREGMFLLFDGSRAYS